VSLEMVLAGKKGGVTEKKLEIGGVSTRRSKNGPVAVRGPLRATRAGKDRSSTRCAGRWPLWGLTKMGVR
jgi:hypothetical protein